MRMELVAFMGFLTLAGCTAYGPGQVAPANAITVDQAFKDVGQGLSDFRSQVDTLGANGKQNSLGLITCRVIVHFNISASANQTTGAGATLAAPIEAFKASVNASEEEAAAAARGNSVLIDLASINPQICAWYEKPSDMYPSENASQSQSSTQNSSQKDTSDTNKNGQNQNQASNPGGNGSGGKDADTNPLAPPTKPPPVQGVIPMNVLPASQ